MEKLINPPFRTGEASGWPSWLHSQQEGTFSLEMVAVELEHSSVFDRHSGISETTACWDTGFALLLKATTSVKGEQVTSSTLHCPTLLSRPETRNPSQPSTSRDAHALLESACNTRLTGRLLLLCFCIQNLLKTVLGWKRP